MNIDLPGGKYVVAVSGGVDSVVLLHLLAQKKNLESRSSNFEATKFQIPNSKFDLVVAHFDHGIRTDSAEDRKLVQELAGKYGLAFECAEGKLGPKASEATAREARYAFLYSVMEKYGADAIVTAHHQDDVLETVILNLLRGTGRRGLTSLKSTETIKRPLLGVPKKELLRYAEREGYQWREDSTNADETYLRNYIRLRLLPRFAGAEREALLELVRSMHETNTELDEELASYMSAQPAPNILNRHEFILLTHAEAREVLAYWLRNQTGVELSSKMLERLVVAAKTGRIGSKVDIADGYSLEISTAQLALKP